ncbi:chemotaxis protein [Clostridium sp.]|uniref:chemotaxis protein n=1 Tax=Clostridium sp. TaxID=1506 RepID=UPI002914C8B2|nr:chemotaxis protein [Clostridium sp.]MDU4476654.1 chemotaxis protein [Clostridium sp.]
MYNIIIFGSGSTSEAVTHSINSKVNIVGYIDNDSNKWNENIYPPNYIQELKYDFIIIASQYNNEIYNQLINMNIDRRKIFEYTNFFLLMNNRFEYNVNLYKNNIEKYKVLITGISYFKNGIQERLLKYNAINFSYDSQDLYYDYQIAKYLIEGYNNNFKYCILGLSYYCFEYDLSLSSMKDNVNLYYNILQEKHNYKLPIDVEERLKICKHIYFKIFNTIENRKENYIYGIKNDITKSIKYDNIEILGKEQAKKDCNKNYPNTVKENVEILEKYIKLLIQNNIKPIIVIPPVTKYYSKYFSERIKNEFFEILNKLKEKYEFQFIDYFENLQFTVYDFEDVSHLNIHGGVKFTEILNKEIKW